MIPRGTPIAGNLPIRLRTCFKSYKQFEDKVITATYLDRDGAIFIPMKIR